MSTPIVPDGFGYNIHFIDAQAGEMEMLADAGATIIRTDFSWSRQEREPGVYDFSGHDRLTASMEKQNIRPMYVVSYSNKHYDQGLSPYTPEGRAAFVRWITAAVTHFKGRRILWEIYNEPNFKRFWTPKPDVEKFAQLALEVGRAIRSVAPDELYVGPATAGIDFSFLESCFKAGLLEYWDAVTVHPYRPAAPETVLTDYARLRYLIDQYAPSGKNVPIISGEWGYSSGWPTFDNDIQGKMLSRQWLVNLAAEIPVMIWYDWNDDGTNPFDPEDHFGIVHHDYRSGQTPVYEPKPAFHAAHTFLETFKGFRFNKRLATENPDEYVFLFDRDNGKQVKLAVWTTLPITKTITIPSVPGKFQTISYLGTTLPDSVADANGLTLSISDTPVYLTPDQTQEQQNDFWTTIARLESLPQYVYGSNIPLRNRTQNSVTVKQFEPSRFSKQTPMIYSETIQGQKIVQKTEVETVTPISIGLPFPDPSCNDLIVKIGNPSNDNFDAKISINDLDGLELIETVRPFKLKSGEPETIIRFPMKSFPVGQYRFSVSLLTDSKTTVIFPRRTMKRLDDFSLRNTESLKTIWNIRSEGDPRVMSEQKAEIENGVVKITYKSDEGWKSIRFALNRKYGKINGKPKALGIQLFGDGSGNNIRLRFVDAKGQWFQAHGNTMTNQAANYFELPFDNTNALHWGGKNDGIVSFPVRFDSILIDGTFRIFDFQTMFISAMTLIYEE
ncbi:MAG: glycoside hydrolase family 5 protein [Planctomycetaceae bacterium]|nr:glycoside hydrolase family 5 protein [Planctomycetaceae bacterium]